MRGRRAQFGRVLIMLAVLCAALPAAAAEEKQTPSWALQLRGGYFGLPDFLADEIFARHPKIRGAMYGAELRYHGRGGPRGVASLGIGFDYGKAEGDGEWQQHEGDAVANAGGEVSLSAFTVTGYWNLYPSWFLHPYVGFGLGLGYLRGSYWDKEGKVSAADWFPVLHVPLGVAIELGERLSLGAEARIIDGIALGGALQVRF